MQGSPLSFAYPLFKYTFISFISPLTGTHAQQTDLLPTAWLYCSFGRALHQHRREHLIEARWRHLKFSGVYERHLLKLSGVSLEAGHRRYAAIYVVRSLPLTSVFSALIFTQTLVKDMSDHCLPWLAQASTCTSKVIETPEICPDQCKGHFPLSFLACTSNICISLSTYFIPRTCMYLLTGHPKIYLLEQ